MDAASSLEAAQTSTIVGQLRVNIFMTLDFAVAELEREMINFKKLAAPFVEVQTRYWLDAVKINLFNIVQSTDVEATWEIDANTPIITCPSNGDHEPGKKKVNDLYGTFSFIWEITPRRSTSRRTGLADRISVTGKASSLLSLYDASGLVSAWTIEIASKTGPGCYFHTQLPRDGLPVPRLPAYPLTPFGALEYLISELFRSRWPRRLGSNVAATTQWSAIQSLRFTRMLEWAASAAKGKGDPLVALQGAQPPATLFL